MLKSGGTPAIIASPPLPDILIWSLDSFSDMPRHHSGVLYELGKCSMPIARGRLGTASQHSDAPGSGIEGILQPDPGAVQVGNDRIGRQRYIPKQQANPLNTTLHI